MTYDYLIAGGGTAGVVVAARLAEDPAVEVCLLEAGPSAVQDPRVLDVRHWPELLGTELDYDYRIEPQSRGNSRIRHSRGRVLGGCSSHNSCIAFRAPDSDLRAWEALGARGWGPEGARTYYDRVLDKVHLEAVPPHNPCNNAFIQAAQQAGFPLITFNQGDVREGVGRFHLNVRGSQRQSSAVAYLHPLDALLANLTVLTETPVQRILLDQAGRAVGLETGRETVYARRDIILCCGTFDTPKLLLLSGIGPAGHLRELGLPVQIDLPSVGEHLLDHPEGVVIWEASQPVPQDTVQFWEVGLFAKSIPSAPRPDLMFHFGLVGFDMHTAASGYPTAEHAISMTPNVAQAKSQGVVRLRSKDPRESPRIDCRYFTDSEGHDERVLLAGIKLARRIASQPALRPWIKRELAPGPDVRDDHDLAEYARRTSNTVYHPAGTCRMGAADDPLAVVDPELRVRGIHGLRIADASIFPAMISVNPGITCMMIGEKCADLVRGIAPPSGGPHEPDRDRPR